MGEHQSNVYTLINTWGGAYRDLPPHDLNLDVTDDSLGVGPIGTEGEGVGPIGTEVGPIGTEVGPIGATNNTHLTRITEQEKELLFRQLTLTRSREINPEGIGQRLE